MTYLTPITIDRLTIKALLPADRSIYREVPFKEGTAYEWSSPSARFKTGVVTVEMLGHQPEPPTVETPIEASVYAADTEVVATPEPVQTDAPKVVTRRRGRRGNAGSA